MPSDCSCAEILVLFLDPVRHLMFEALLLPRLLAARNVLKEAVAEAGSGQLDVKATRIYERRIQSNRFVTLIRLQSPLDVLLVHVHHDLVHKYGDLFAVWYVRRVELRRSLDLALSCAGRALDRTHLVRLVVEARNQTRIQDCARLPDPGHGQVVRGDILVLSITMATLLVLPLVKQILNDEMLEWSLGRQLQVRIVEAFAVVGLVSAETDATRKLGVERVLRKDEIGTDL